MIPIVLAMVLASSTVVVGDSLSEGTRQSVSWPTLLDAECTLCGPVFNVAVSGSGAADCVHQWRVALVEHPDTDTVIIWCGVNDLRKGRSASYIEERLDVLVREARTAHVRVVIATIAPWAKYETWTAAKQVETERLNTWIRNGSPAFVVDLYTYLNDTASPASLLDVVDVGDGLHLNDHGAGLVESLFALTVDVGEP